MPAWVCDIVGAKSDGSFSWRRHGATEPRGTLPRSIALPGLTIGQQVILTVAREWGGDWTVTACRPSGCGAESPATEPVFAAATSDSSLRCGQIRWTSIRNPLENPLSIGKERPALLVSDLGRVWRVMGLTTKDRHEDGQLRTPIPDHVAVGLPAPGYLWGRRLTRVVRDDIGDLIGSADRRLVAAVLDLAGADLHPEELDRLCAFQAAIPPPAPTLNVPVITNPARRAR